MRQRGLALSLVALLVACSSTANDEAEVTCPDVEEVVRTPDAALDAVDAFAVVTVTAAPSSPAPCDDATTTVDAERIDLSPWPAGRTITVTEPAGHGHRLAALAQGSRALVLLEDLEPGPTDEPGRWRSWAVVPLVGDTVQPSGNDRIDDLVSRATGGTDDVRRLAGWFASHGVAESTLADPATATLHLTVTNRGVDDPDDLVAERLAVAIDGTFVFDHGVPGYGAAAVALDLVVEPGAHVLQTRAASGAVGAVQFVVGDDPVYISVDWVGPFFASPEGIWVLEVGDEPFPLE